MMGIYVNGIEMPEAPDEMIELAIFGDGKTLKTGESWRSPVDGKCYYGLSEDMNTYSALTVPSHGRLIDADALKKIVADPKHMDADIYNGRTFYSDHLCVGADYDDVCAAIDETPTVIPAEEGET